MIIKIKSQVQSYYRFCRVSLLVGCLTGVGCKEIVNGADLPSDIMDSGVLRNERGAKMLYEGVLSNVLAYYGGALSSHVRISGMISDELGSVQGNTGPFPEGTYSLIDARLITESDNDPTFSSNVIEDPIYVILNRMRSGALEARGITRKYTDSEETSSRIAMLQTFEALTVIMLAELYCSGIPLSTVDFEKNYTLTRGFSTNEILEKAVLLLDSAEQMTNISDETRYLASHFKARALLQMGKLDEAFSSISGVPTSFRYTLRYTAPPRPELSSHNKYWVSWEDQLSDNEGNVGIRYLSGNDPRPLLFDPLNQQGDIILANGLEKNLVEAEYLLVHGDIKWLDALNSLRTTCAAGEACGSPAPEGLGGVAGLNPLTDPASGASMSDTAAFRTRMALVFHERAMWLYMTGRRHADMRRMVRNYGWLQSQVFPTGNYGMGSYGREVNLPVPNEERRLNRNYTGCINRDA